MTLSSSFLSLLATSNKTLNSYKTPFLKSRLGWLPTSFLSTPLKLNFYSLVFLPNSLKLIILLYLCLQALPSNLLPLLEILVLRIFDSKSLFFWSHCSTLTVIVTPLRIYVTSANSTTTTTTTTYHASQKPASLTFVNDAYSVKHHIIIIRVGITCWVLYISTIWVNNLITPKLYENSKYQQQQQFSIYYFHRKIRTNNFYSKSLSLN